MIVVSSVLVFIFGFCNRFSVSMRLKWFSLGSGRVVMFSRWKLFVGCCLCVCFKVCGFRFMLSIVKFCFGKVSVSVLSLCLLLMLRVSIWFFVGGLICCSVFISVKRNIGFLSLFICVYLFVL